MLVYHQGNKIFKNVCNKHLIWIIRLCSNLLNHSETLIYAKDYYVKISVGSVKLWKIIALKSFGQRPVLLGDSFTWVLIWKNKPLMFNIGYFLCTPRYRVETNWHRVMVSTDATCRCKFNFHMSDMIPQRSLLA